MDVSIDRAPDAFAVLHALYWVTAGLAESQPLLLAIDDVHWSDAASLDYLGFLLPRLEELPVLVAIANRPEEPEPPGGLGPIVTDALACRLEPKPLTLEAVTAMLAEGLGLQPAPAFAAACEQVSGGNPFLLSELIHALQTQEIDPGAEQAALVLGLASERVARSVLMRMARLSPQADSIARALAVLGDDSDTHLVAELAEVGMDDAQRAADALRESAILDPGGSLRFIHPLVRNALYADIAAGERAQAHARAATILRSHRASLERTATQLVASAPKADRWVVQTLIEAGERALASGASKSAIAYLTRALREPPPADLRAAVLGPLLTAGARAADQATLMAIDEDVRAELERDPSLRLRWADQMTAGLSITGRVDRLVSLLEQAIEAAVEIGDVERALQLEVQLSTLSVALPGMPRRSLERYRGLGPEGPSARLDAARAVHAASQSETANDATRAAKRALGHDSLIFAEGPVFVAPVVVTAVLVAADDLDTAQRAAERALAFARDREMTVVEAAAWSMKALVAGARGDLDAAVANARQAVDITRLSGILGLVPVYAAQLIHASIERGELEPAEAELHASGLASGPVPATPAFESFLLARGVVLLEQGRFAQAAEDLAALSADADRPRLGPGLVAAASPATVRALLAVDRHERAMDLARQALAAAERWGTPSGIAAALRGLARAGPRAEAVERLQRAVAVLDGSPRCLERAHALAELGIALRHGGQLVEARAPLRDALELARRCGASALARRTYDELSAAGEKPRRHTPIGAESLSPAERRVAELAATGLTNRRIAQDLFVTVKTVEAHLSASYDKLGIRSRQGLSAALGT